MAGPAGPGGVTAQTNIGLAMSSSEYTDIFDLSSSINDSLHMLFGVGANAYFRGLACKRAYGGEILETYSSGIVSVIVKNDVIVGPGTQYILTGILSGGSDVMNWSAIPLV